MILTFLDAMAAAGDQPATGTEDRLTVLHRSHLTGHRRGRAMRRCPAQRQAARTTEPSATGGAMTPAPARSGRPPGDEPCRHQPRCPDALAPDRSAARAVASHPEQGWSLLCNGVVLFDDGGELLPASSRLTVSVAA